MYIEKVIIKNYKKFKNLSFDLNKDFNILVGDNESGKSTIVEAINLALTGQINGKNISNELSPYMFNKDVSDEYIKAIRSGNKKEAPEILIELYFHYEKDEYFFIELKGTNNSLAKDSSGVYIKMLLDTDYADDYGKYIQNKDSVRFIPTEYYKIEWLSFAGTTYKFKNLSSIVTFIDRSESRALFAPDRNIIKTACSLLDKPENAVLDLIYRLQKEKFCDQKEIKDINDKLQLKARSVTDKSIKLSLDVGSNNKWDSNLAVYFNDVPYKYIGKGEQGKIRTNLSLISSQDYSNIVLIEEPETALSYHNLLDMLNKIKSQCENKQLIITTHSTFVLNKIGLEKLILLNDGATMKLDSLNEETYNFFKSMPGYDTLRLVIAEKSILVEGKSDELIITKAYIDKYGHAPILDGVDIICINGLAFKRFLEIGMPLNKKIIVVTDNDGKYEDKIEKYKPYTSNPNIKLCMCNNNSDYTLEPCLVTANSLDSLNNILSKSYDELDDLINYMIKNKTECALKIFETKEQVKMPEYIQDAIK